MEQLGKTSKIMLFEGGEIIGHEGRRSRGWFILLSGRVGVFKQQLKLAEFTQKGMVFGEISTILDRPRTATLKAIVTSEVLYIEESLDQLIVTHPDIARKIIVSLAERLTKTTDDYCGAMANRRY